MTVASLFAVMGLAAIPVASADDCTVVDHGRRRSDVHVPERAAGHRPLAAAAGAPADRQRRASCPPVTATTPAATVTATTPAPTTSPRPRPRPRPRPSRSRRPGSSSTTTSTTDASRPPSRVQGLGSASRSPHQLNPGTAQAGSNVAQPAAPKNKKKKKHRRPTHAAAAGDQGRRSHAGEPDLLVRAARSRADRRPELLHRQLPDPAVPAADLSGGRHPVQRAVAGPGRDQRDRDRLRPQPVGLHRGRRGLDAVHALDLEALRRRRQRRRRGRPLQPGRRDLQRRPLPARGRRLQEHLQTRSSPTTTPAGTSSR